MRTSTEQLGRVLRGGSFRCYLTFDVVYGSAMLLEGVTPEDWSFDGDLDAEIPTGGTLTVVYQDEFARSYTPREATDAFAPAGQRVIPYLNIKAGPFTERIRLGVFRISEVPDARDEFLRLGARRLVVGSRIELKLLDLFDGVRRARFRTVEQPKALTSTWAEIARVTGMSVTRTVADAVIPKTIQYDRSRLTTLQLLASNLDGRAVMLADGSIGVVPNTATPAVGSLGIGEEGVILDVGYSLDSDVPNVVVGDFEDALGQEIHVESVTRTGPYRFDGPYGEHVVDYPTDRADLIDTRAAAQLAVDAYRIRLATPNRFAPVSILLDPRIELGDVYTIERPDRVLTARVHKWAISKDSPQQLTVEVLDDEPLDE